MKCSASQTISTAAESAAATPVANDDAEETRQATRAFEGMVAAMIVKPVADAMGPLGGTFGDVVARAAIVQKGASDT